MSDSVRPHRRQPTRLRHPWDPPGKNAGVGCHFLLQCMKVKSESEVTQSCRTLRDPMDCSLQAPLSMGFSRQETWSGVPSPSPIHTYIYMDFPVGSAGKESTCNAGDLGCREDPLEKEKAIHSSILAWRTAWPVYNPCIVDLQCYVNFCCAVK